MARNFFSLIRDTKIINTFCFLIIFKLSSHLYMIRPLKSIPILTKFGFISKPNLPANHINVSSMSYQHNLNSFSLYSNFGINQKYFMASKKKQDKDEQKRKEKEKIKQQIGGDVTEIDLNKYEVPYQRIVENYKSFLSKCRAGKLDSTSFDDIEVKIGKQKMQVKHLAQIAPKNAVSVIVNPYDSDNLDPIEKAIKASDDTLQILKIEKSLSVSLPNSSIQELKTKMVDKVKKSLNDQKELLKKQRHVCHEDLKKYEKIAQKDKLKQIEKEAKDLFEKYNEMLEKLTKEKEKQLLK